MQRQRRRRDALWNEKRGSFHRLKLILGIPTTAQDQRGFAAEDKAEEALRYLARKRLIDRYIRTVRFSPDDLSGKDFIVTLLTGHKIAINVKNHRWTCHEEKAYREKGILLVTIWECDTDEIAREKMLNLIVSAYLSRLGLYKVRELIEGALGEGIAEPPRSFLEMLRTCLKN